MSVDATLLVDVVMPRWPTTIRVFLDHRMRCIGCPIAGFHTVDDACREHGVERTRFLADLQTVADCLPIREDAMVGLSVRCRPARPRSKR